tara:strand:+ start:1661 stop:2215 length:555 start_codon:yes stop_codon:yes gene_type:complete
MILISSIYASANQLSFDNPSDNPDNKQPLIDPNINYNSFINTNIDLSQPVSVTYLSWGNPQLDPFSPMALVNQYTNSASVVLEFLTKVLFYPNPFRLLDHTQIGFKTSKDVPENSMEIQIYDMRGLEVFKSTIAEPIKGNEYTKLAFSESTFGKPIPDMSSGVYIFLLLSEGEVLGKGKFVIKP